MSTIERDAFNENVDFDELKGHQYDDSPGYTFYECPLCGNEYLPTFFTNVNGQDMCIDCYTARYGD